MWEVMYNAIQERALNECMRKQAMFVVDAASFPDSRNIGSLC